ncbi:MAG: EamA family transporter [Actinobacteria bacterium]|nr:EamA family transporter [Actinomycetota bacterium]
MGRSRRLWLALGTIYVVWGSTYLAIRVAVETLPPFLMAATRFLAAGALLFVWAIRRGDVREDRVGRAQWKSAALIGGLLLLGGNGGVVWAAQRVATSVSSLLIATVPIWMAIMAARIGRERIRGRTVAGLVIGFAGTALLVRSAGATGGPVDSLGVAVLIGSAVCWATGSVLSGRLPLPRRPLVATAMEMLAGGSMLMMLGVLTGELSEVHLDRISLASALGLGYLIVFGSLIAFSAYIWLLGNASTSLVSTYAYVNPVVAVFLGWSVLDEPIGARTLIAAGLILAAVVLILTAEARRRHDLREPAPPGDGVVAAGGQAMERTPAP